MPSPAASDASRATLPTLCPWRTIQSLAGHLCLIAEMKSARGVEVASVLLPGSGRSLQQPLGLQSRAQIVGVREQMPAHPYRLRALDVDLAVVDEQPFVRLKPEAVEGEIVDGRIGLEQPDLARDDDVAEAAEKGVLARPERRPEVGREIGDGEERHAPRVQRLDNGVDPGD